MKEQVYENQIAIKWASAIVSPVLAIIYGAEYELPKKSAAFEIVKTMTESGEKQAGIRAKEIFDNQLDGYYLDNDEFEFFKGELIRKGMTDQSLLFNKIYKK